MYSPTVSHTMYSPPVTHNVLTPISLAQFTHPLIRAHCHSPTFTHTMYSLIVTHPVPFIQCHSLNVFTHSPSNNVLTHCHSHNSTHPQSLIQFQAHTVSHTIYSPTVTHTMYSPAVIHTIPLADHHSHNSPNQPSLTLCLTHIHSTGTDNAILSPSPRLPFSYSHQPASCNADTPLQVQLVFHLAKAKHPPTPPTNR